jgi:hypothetical protein
LDDNSTISPNQKKEVKQPSKVSPIKKKQQ